MKHFQILQRSWRTLWSYRTLWIFGIILALTTASPNFGNGSNANNQANPQAFNNFTANIPQPVVNALIGVGIGLACLVLLLGVVFTFAHYISNTALIRMVDRDESTGEKVTWRQGFRLGWTRIIAIVATIGLAFLLIFLAAVASLLLSMLMNFIYRVCVLTDAGVFASIRQGWQMLRTNLKDIFLMWLLTIGVRFVYTFALIPVVILLLGIGLVIGGGVALVLYGISSLSISGITALVPGIAVGGIILIFILAVPLTFLGGLKETYLSTTWTLSYLDLKSLNLPDFEGSSQPPSVSPA